MSLNNRLKRLELYQKKGEPFHVITMDDWRLESLENAIDKYEIKNKCKVNYNDGLVIIHIKSPEQIRAERNK